MSEIDADSLVTDHGVEIGVEDEDDENTHDRTRQRELHASTDSNYLSCEEADEIGLTEQRPRGSLEWFEYMHGQLLRDASILGGTARAARTVSIVMNTSQILELKSDVLEIIVAASLIPSFHT